MSAFPSPAATRGRSGVLIVVAFLAGCAFLAGWAADARAAATLIVDAATQVTLVVDRVNHTPPLGAQRITVEQLPPGRHRIEVRSATGQVLYQNEIELADKMVTQARWTAEGFFEVVGTSSAAPGQAVTERYGEGKVASDQGQGSRDKSGSRSSYSSRYAGYDGADTVARAASSVAPVAASAVSGSTLGTTIAVGSAVGSGVSSFARNSEAGGMGYQGPSSDARQGNPNAPPAVTSPVTFTCRGGMGAQIYMKGSQVAEIADEGGKVVMPLEVGQHEVEIWSAATGKPVYRGLLRVDEGVPVEVAFSAWERPQVVSGRPWLWTER